MDEAGMAFKKDDRVQGIHNKKHGIVIKAYPATERYRVRWDGNVTNTVVAASVVKKEQVRTRS